MVTFVSCERRVTCTLTAEVRVNTGRAFYDLIEPCLTMCLTVFFTTCLTVFLTTCLTVFLTTCLTVSYLGVGGNRSLDGCSLGVWPLISVS